MGIEPTRDFVEPRAGFEDQEHTGRLTPPAPRHGRGAAHALPGPTPDDIRLGATMAGRTHLGNEEIAGNWAGQGPPDRSGLATAREGAAIPHGPEP